jgi:5-methylcytosine-specific restriction endonuclease McrA
VLLEAGYSQADVAAKLGVTKSTVAFHARRLDVPLDPRFAHRYDWGAIRAAYNSGLTMDQCRRRFGFSRFSWYDAVRRGDILLRPWIMDLERDLLVAGRRTARGHLKKRLLREGVKQNRCEVCGISEWRGQSLSMALHHVNGDGLDNRLENLELLCPNCHSQTSTYGGRNGHRKPAAHSD